MEMIGRTFGRLSIISEYPRDRHRHRMWMCICSCGVSRPVLQSSLLYGHTKSCGCYGKELALKSVTKHRLSNSRVFKIYHNMINRCNNRKIKNYKNYGGRGITVCDRWKLFENFLADMGHPPEGLTLERRNVNGNYDIDNCYWASKIEQSRNKRDTIWLTYRGDMKPLVVWSEELGINYYTMWNRHKAGWSDDRILTTVVRTSLTPKKV